MRKIFFPLFVVIVIMSLSCQKTYQTAKTNQTKAANGWWVTFTLGGVDVYGIGTKFLTTYNTSANDDSIWVDDLANTWDFKCKAKINKDLTFSTTSSQNEYYNITVTLANGKILPKAGKSRAGNPTDSIYVEATFSDDPTNTYVIAGTARTGFIEDDY